MPNRVKRNSVVDLLSKVPVNRGSLLRGIENLLKTIESSESAVMIPTLLRDKCEFDAWELLFVAKILKASILGHSDLVEFYMNHIGHTWQNAAASNGTSNGAGLESPPIVRQSADSPVPVCPVGQAADGMASPPVAAAAPLAAQPAPSPTSNGSNGSSSSSLSAALSLTDGGHSSPSNTPTNGCSESVPQQQPSELQSEALLAARPLLLRAAQPPSLLQLTTTNNHINSVVGGFTNNNIEQLTSQLSAMQQTAASAAEGPLSISTAAANQQSAGNGNGNGTASSSLTAPSELRSSRSAGCLFRINSGASSPRTPAQTPTTPYPQAETLANGAANSLPGDPSAPVRLLLQIEQLKSSISHVTSLLESVVELYKKSIDNIALA